MKILSIEEKLIEQISELQSKLYTQNRYIDYANKNLDRFQRENKDLNACLSDMTLQSETLEKQHYSLHIKYEEAISKLNLAEATNIQLQSQIVVLQQSLFDMENSRSWKLTKPLRAIKWWFWRIFKKGKAQ